MPYFERKPWQAAEHNVSSMDGVGADGPLDFARAAQRVLAQEAQRKQRAIGPFRTRQPAQPGGQARLRLSISAHDGSGAFELKFTCSDLTADEGRVIPAHNVRFSPEDVHAENGARVVVEVLVDVPRATLPGAYSGHVAGEGSENVNFDIVVEVDAPA